MLINTEHLCEQSVYKNKIRTQAQDKCYCYTAVGGVSIAQAFRITVHMALWLTNN